MRPAETIAHLDGFSGRGAGSDGERRAAVWLARQLEARTGPGGTARKARLEPFWCRPNWALAQSSGVAAAISLVRALDASPPLSLTVDLLLQGAGDAEGRGLRQYLRRRRQKRPARDSVVLLAVAPRSHQAVDTPAAIDIGAIDQAVEFATLLVNRIDAFFASRPVRATTPA